MFPIVTCVRPIFFNFLISSMSSSVSLELASSPLLICWRFLETISRKLSLAVPMNKCSTIIQAGLSHLCKTNVSVLKISKSNPLRNAESLCARNFLCKPFFRAKEVLPYPFLVFAFFHSLQSPTKEEDRAKNKLTSSLLSLNGQSCNLSSLFFIVKQYRPLWSNPQGFYTLRLAQ